MYMAKDGESPLGGTPDKRSDIQKMMEEDRSRIGIIRNRQRKWLGHILRRIPFSEL